MRRNPRPHFRRGGVGGGRVAAGRRAGDGAGAEGAAVADVVDGEEERGGRVAHREEVGVEAERV